MRWLAILLLVVAPHWAAAQESAEPEEDNGYIVNTIQEKLSSENRQIRFSGISGLLSSAATVERITIADRDGVWLEIRNARIVWTRSALLLGQLEVDTLAADEIVLSRRPLPDTSLPAPEATPFSLPELPVSVNLGQLEVGRLELGQPVIGEAAEMALTGRISLADGELDSHLEMQRSDGPGGTFLLDASFKNENRELAVNLDFREPAGGIVATLTGIPGRPALDLTASGAGPLAAFDLDLGLSADGQTILTGRTETREADGATAFTARLDGDVQPLIPEAYRAFFSGDSLLSVRGSVPAAGGAVVDELKVASAALDLTVALGTRPDGFLSSLSVAGRIGSDGTRTVLPVAGGGTSIETALVDVTYGEGETWDGAITLKGLQSGGITVADADITLGGVSRNLDRPEDRQVTGTATLAASGLAADDPDVAAALGSRLGAEVVLDWQAGKPLLLQRLSVEGEALSVAASGGLQDGVFSGTFRAAIDRLVALSGLAGRDLGGSLALTAAGTVTPLSGGFNLGLNGDAADLRLGIAALDGLLAGDTALEGRLIRDETGIRAERFTLDNPQLRVSADGALATGATDFTFDAALADIAALTPQATGALAVSGRASGRDGPVLLSLSAAMAEGRLGGRSLSDARLGFDGNLSPEGALDGRVQGSASYAGAPLDLAAELRADGEVRALRGIDIALQGATITGAVEQGGDGLLAGGLEIEITDAAPLAGLALVDAKGALSGTVTLGRDGALQTAAAELTAAGLEAAGIGVGRLDASVTVGDLFGVPLADGNLTASAVTVAGIVVDGLDATARTAAGTMHFEAEAELLDGATATLAGALARAGQGFALNLDAAALEKGSLSARLLAPAALTVEAGRVAFPDLQLSVGGGTVTASGSVAEMLDISVEMADLGLDIVNVVRPDLGLTGSVGGRARITGTPAAPEGIFSLTGAGIGAAALSETGLATFDVTADGRLADRAVSLEAAMQSADGLRSSVTGIVPLPGNDAALDVDVDLAAFPLAVLNPVAGNPGLSGTVTGTAKVTGTLDDPAATFGLTGNGLNARALSQNGIGPLSASAEGSYGGGRITLDKAEASGPSGVGVTASGTLPLAGPGLAISANGTLPLALLDLPLADRGTQAQGSVRIDGRAEGSLTQPQFAAELALAGGVIVDPSTNVRLQDVSLAASLTGDRLVIRQAGGALAGGGRFALDGSVGLNPAQGFPADLRLSIPDGVYSNGDFLQAKLSADLTLTGPALGGGTLAGQVTLHRTEIVIPEGFGISEGAVLDVRHINTPRGVALTLDRAGLTTSGRPPDSSQPAADLRLDLSIDAPNQIFVRGRGLDTELGGRLTVRGDIGNLVPAGGFEMLRGRLSLLGQRIEFDEGRVTLQGTLDPVLDFVARTEGSDVTVIVTVTGRASAPEIGFTSVPQLPEDEVLARLIFDRPVAELSAFQLARLAASVATLRGGEGGVVGGLRKGFGLDNLDLTTGEDGEVGVAAGKYLRDNVYLDLEADSAGGTKATINLDLTPSLTARGSVDSEGETSLGIFFERDY